MSRDKSYLFDIQNSGKLILEFTTGMTLENFRLDVLRQDAVFPRLEIIGEAAGNLSEEFRQKHNNIPWQKIRGMRNRLVHDNNEVDIDLVWTTCNEDIPDLLKRIENILD